MLLFVLTAAATAAEADWKTIETDHLRVVWAPETLATLGLAAGYALVLEQAEPRTIGGAWVPSGIDGRIAPQWSPRADAVSDFLAIPTEYYGFNLPVLTLAGVGVWAGLAEDDWRAGAANSLIVAESLVSTAFVTALWKNGRSRPRPYTAERFAAAYPGVVADPEFQAEFTEEGHWDAYKSMPSGHTSAATAVGVSTATLIWLWEREHQDRRWVGAVAYGGAAALGVGTGVSRVLAGRHHPTDTMAGFVLGAGMGLAVPLLHTTGGVGLAAGPSTFRVQGTF